MRRLPALAVTVLSAMAQGCGDPAAACLDRDQDGFGPGCPAGDDCDDRNAMRNVDCDAVPAPDCAEEPEATGCACLAGTRAECYPGPRDTAGRGRCVAGRATCVDGRWGLCRGAVTPRTELCDGADDDCDGLVDDGVESPCGGCDPTCRGGVWGEASAPFAAGDGLAVTSSGHLTLARDDPPPATTVWVANSAEGTLSRIDAASARETARYRTGGAEPSRVAVDYRGDAWVVNREFDGVTTVTKVSGTDARCIDRDGDGSIRTSSAPTDVLPHGEDECVLFTTAVPPHRGVGRALAIDGSLGLDGASGGNAWVGLEDAELVAVIDGETGAIVEELPTPGFSPYAAAFDPWGSLWLADRDGLLARIRTDARDHVVELIEAPLACFLFYSLAIDRAGVLYLSGFSCDQITRFDPQTGAWATLATEASPRGVVLEDDSLWLAHTAGLLSRVDVARWEVDDVFDLVTSEARPRESIGIGADSRGGVWVVSTGGGPNERGLATLVDHSGDVEVHVPVGRAPHTQGDLTGTQLLGGYVPTGATTHVFGGCEQSATEWQRVHLRADGGAAASVRVEARHAPSREDLGRATFEHLGTWPENPPPFALDVPAGGALELRATLSVGARDGAPRVERLGVEWRCPDDLE